eukprot:TRINITY_DN54038_c0_g1_i1.p1 TRINITY_DN54038_c0_g1~~TRINITY_DN54038_c0_g1_i1.p1  ORF type:complete len:210 (-),score=38.44 TRINITY_DN54038_c0_g1_i1:46-627(-)
MALSISEICAAARCSDDATQDDAHAAATLPHSRLERLAAFKAKREEVAATPEPELQAPRTSKPLAKNSLLQPKGGPEIKPSLPPPPPPDMRSRQSQRLQVSGEPVDGAAKRAEAQSTANDLPLPPRQRVWESAAARNAGGQSRSGRAGELRGRGRHGRGGRGASRGHGRCQDQDVPRAILAGYTGYTREVIAG